MKSFIKIFFLYVLIPLASIITLLVAYSEITSHFGGVIYPLNEMYTVSQKNRWAYVLQYNHFELLLITIVYYSLFFILEKNKHRYWISLLPIILFYVFYDSYFMSFGGVFKIDDIAEIPELLDVLALKELLLYLAVFGVVIWAIVTHITKNKRRRLWVLAAPVAMWLSVNVFPNSYITAFEGLSRLGVTQWSDRDTAHNGYLSTTFYFEAMMHQGRQMLSKLNDQGPAYEAARYDLAQWVQRKGNQRNIHIIVLESFFNPALFKELKFNQETYAKTFAQMVGDQESTIISPVFGGHTSQAEFEILCGVPALHKYSAIEFNSFTGEKAFCLPGILKEAGYRVVASNSYKPNFFNAVHAYRGIGFDEIYFPKDYAPKKETYLKLVDKTKYIFDGDLLDQNIDFVQKHIAQQDKKPILNYVLGVYGHLEYVLDKKRHPIIVKPINKKADVAENVVRAFNQIYYRSQALAVYINKLRALDPDSLIILTSDHLPRLSGKGFYAQMKYRNNVEDSIHKTTAFYIVNSQFKKQDELHQYEVNNVILDYLTNNQYCQTYRCERDSQTLSDQYDLLMSRAVQ
jgi:phosphoglycerol transferase MdoB-like AlkP superfamily enzyme